MGFFDKILNALGFEDENECKDKISKKGKIKSVNTVKIKSKFDLEEASKEKTIKKHKPQTQDEIEIISNDLINGTNVFINLSEFSDIDRIRALDFLSGVTYVLNGKIEKQNDNTYAINVTNQK